jgi:hypothetical protein
VIAVVGYAAAAWLFFGTLMFRHIELRPTSVAEGLAIMALDALPAAAGLASAVRWLAGSPPASLGAVALATRWAALLALVALPVPLLMGVVPVTPPDLVFRALQAVALFLLLDGPLGPD